MWGSLTPLMNGCIIYVMPSQPSPQFVEVEKPNEQSVGHGVGPANILPSVFLNALMKGSGRCQITGMESCRWARGGTDDLRARFGLFQLPFYRSNTCDPFTMANAWSNHLNEAVVVVVTWPNENLAGDVWGHIMKQDFGIIPDDFIPVPLLCAVTLPEFSAPWTVYPDSSSSGSSVQSGGAPSSWRRSPPELWLWEMQHSSSPVVWTKHRNFNNLSARYSHSHSRAESVLPLLVPHCHSLSDYWQKCPVVSQWSPQPWTSLPNVDISGALPRLEENETTQRQNLCVPDPFQIPGGVVQCEVQQIPKYRQRGQPGRAVLGGQGINKGKRSSSWGQMKQD